MMPLCAGFDPKLFPPKLSAVFPHPACILPSPSEKRNKLLVGIIHKCLDPNSLEFEDISSPRFETWSSLIPY
jgi:hypothetical protein